jgi:hypothetical protein
MQKRDMRTTILGRKLKLIFRLLLHALRVLRDPNMYLSALLLMKLKSKGTATACQLPDALLQLVCVCYIYTHTDDSGYLA